MFIKSEILAALRKQTFNKKKKNKHVSFDFNVVFEQKKNLFVLELLYEHLFTENIQKHVHSKISRIALKKDSFLNMTF